MRTESLLPLIAQIRPEVWDAIAPHTPRAGRGSDRASLNPQPLPPSEAFLINAVDMAHEVARIAVESDIRGEPSGRIISEVVDDWCATPWPRKWPWGGPGPRPLDDGPLPDPWVISTGRVIGAMIFSSAGSRLDKGELRTALLDGAERLAEAAATS
ncbi:hypothetical protein M2280_005390 [Prescottella agglutinans]|jgi:hypothetical protein|uniref:Uncharacterized protein n=1 Tax=Prescottella agglutinans TaxID=1644129 RepID=A0ABT6MIJ0_9NOCA|nr:hypothetical protein [Prescottella agglutinans]